MHDKGYGTRVVELFKIKNVESRQQALEYELAVYAAYTTSHCFRMIDQWTTAEW
jgi:hypothetical protein